MGDGGPGGEHAFPRTHDPSPYTLDLVESLVAKSLVRQEDEPDGAVRFGMFETIREYASELLDASGELTALRDRHLNYFLTFAEAAKPELQGPLQASWFDRLERENDNLRAALEWSAAGAGPNTTASTDGAGTSTRVEAGTKLAEALGFFWVLRGRGRPRPTRACPAASDAGRSGTGTHATAGERGAVCADERHPLRVHPVGGSGRRVVRA
jgi:hypothetical protein